MGILRLDNVSYTYSGKYQTVRAVNGACADFELGRVYAIVGKSGSGKTTLLSLLAGLDIPTEGEVLYGGVSTRKMDLDKYRREEISVIYQSYNLFPLLTLTENVTYPLELRGVDRKQAAKVAEEMLLTVGLRREQFRRYPAMLSGGEQQRVAIARTLACQAKVILADEPTGNLDVENGNNVVRMLLELAHKLDYCVIIVTHDNALAAKADVRLRMQDGVLTREE